MCGRFAFDGEQWPDIVTAELPDIEPNYNISLQDNVHCLTMENEAHNITSMKWGFRPSWSKKSSMEPINARFETVSEKPMFRDSFQRRRCLVPANGWYEWKTTPSGKVPFYHQSEGNATIFFAGIYDDWVDGNQAKRTFCILTTTSHDSISHIHERMPLIIPRDSVNNWLENGTFKMMPLPINVHPVDRKVNSTTAQGVGLTSPIRTLFD